MTVINGLPAHILFVHLLVVLVPLTALLEIVCALSAPVRRGHLVWLTLILAIATAVMTPVTTHAGEWLYDLRRHPDPLLVEHAERGGWMIYFAAGLVIVAIALVWQSVAERRSESPRKATNTVIAIVALAVGISSVVQLYRIGDSGSESVWGNEITHLKQANAKQ